MGGGEEVTMTRGGDVKVDIMWRDTPKVDVFNNRFPYAIVWGPLGPLTCCCPVVGHMGIGDSQGRIHDFAGPYTIGVDHFMVGCVWRYAVVSSPSDTGWDGAIEHADDVYRGRFHDICCDNWSAPRRTHALRTELPRAALFFQTCPATLGGWVACSHRLSSSACAATTTRRWRSTRPAGLNGAAPGCSPRGLPAACTVGARGGTVRACTRARAPV